MKEAYFKIPNIGDLFLHKVLLQIDIPPLLFVCIDRKGKYYLGECIESYEFPYKYLIVPTTSDILIQMLNNKIAMYDAFRMSPEKIAFIIKEAKELNNDVVDSLQIDDVLDEDLPFKGVLFEIDTDYVKDYISELQGYKAYDFSQSSKCFVKSDQSYIPNYIMKPDVKLGKYPEYKIINKKIIKCMPC
jgi:hypothetical protein